MGRVVNHADLLHRATRTVTERAYRGAWLTHAPADVTHNLAVLFRIAAAHRADVDRLNAHVGAPEGQTFQGYSPWTDRVIDLAKAVLGEQP